MILLAATVVWQNVASATADPAGAVSRVPVPDSPILIGQSPVKGNASARVALIEYSDFECPYCAKVAKEIEPVIRRDYIDTGRADGLAASAVKADRAEGEGLKVGGTPIFFIGVVEGDRAVRVKYVLSGAKPLDAFTTILDKLLN